MNANARPYIILNDVSSRSIQGLLISELPPISKPQQRIQTETVDGRDGDIVTPLGFAAYDKLVKISLTYDYDIDDIIEFFNSSGKVIFSNEPEKYYKYAIYKQIDFESLIRFKTAKVNFHVQPFKFSDTESTKTFTFASDDNKSLIIRNNGNIYSRPTLTITGSDTVNIYINGSQILSISLNIDQTIVINAETMNATNKSGSRLLNRLVTGNYDNIKLNIGSNRITFTGAISKILIDNYSRWI
jgi:predicted phage tail component-like protein